MYLITRVILLLAIICCFIEGWNRSRDRYLRLVAVDEIMYGMSIPLIIETIKVIWHFTSFKKPTTNELAPIGAAVTCFVVDINNGLVNFHM